MTTDPLLSCWASTSPGLEGLAAGELEGLSLATTGIEPGGVAFSATADQLADALLRCRTPSRLTIRLGAFSARTFSELEKHAARIAWDRVIRPGAAVHFRITSKKSRLYHQDAIAERLERVTLGTIPGSTAVRAPSAAEAMEDDVTTVPNVQRIIVRVFRDEVTLSADASGALLHLRGWRQAVAKAPMRETLAASLVIASGWPHSLRDGSGAPLLDPFCGSGTVAIEAALMARRMAPGRMRRFAAEAWPMIGAAVFDGARTRAQALEVPSARCEIMGYDRDEGAIRAATSNAERTGVGGDITFARATISQLLPDQGSGFVVTNPPYGARIGERTALRDLYATLGRIMSDRRPRWSLTMLSADRMLASQTRMRLADVLRTTNGGIPVAIVKSGEGLKG